MEAALKVRERAERYRQIAQNTFDTKVANEIERIARDYETRAMLDDGPMMLDARGW
ncbi:MAG TPA: hypothetical protein VN766_15605 [Stellaceae bacterium]|jgi:hypothetical protein|nr:hypothetical protein [Stellaceae bacterium]